MLRFLILGLFSFSFSFSFSLFAADDVFKKAYLDLTQNTGKTEQEKACNFGDYNEYRASVYLRSLGEKKLKRIINLGIDIPSPSELDNLITDNSLSNYRKYSPIPPYQELKDKLNKIKKNILDLNYFKEKYKGDSEKSDIAYRAYLRNVSMRISMISKESYTASGIADNEHFIWGATSYASYVNSSRPLKYNSHKPRYEEYILNLAQVLFQYEVATNLGFEEWMDSINFNQCNPDYGPYGNRDQYDKDTENVLGKCYKNFWDNTRINMSSAWDYERKNGLRKEQFESLPCQGGQHSNLVDESSRSQIKDIHTGRDVKKQNNSKAKKQ